MATTITKASSRRKSPPAPEVTQPEVDYAMTRAEAFLGFLFANDGGILIDPTEDDGIKWGELYSDGDIHVKFQMQGYIPGQKNPGDALFGILELLRKTADDLERAMNRHNLAIAGKVVRA